MELRTWNLAGITALVSIVALGCSGSSHEGGTAPDGGAGQSGAAQGGSGAGMAAAGGGGGNVGAPPGTPAPPLAPKLLVLTYIGGAGDQWINDVGFLPTGDIYAKGTMKDASGADIGGFQVTYDAAATKGTITGDIQKAMPPGFDYGARPNDYLQMDFKIPKDHTGTTFDDAQRSQTVRAGWYQPGSSSATIMDACPGHGGGDLDQLQQPFVIAEKAGAQVWKLWDWGVQESFDHCLFADTRMYNAWWIPGTTYLGVQLRADGGNSTADKDPRDLTKDAAYLANSWQTTAGGLGTQFALIDTALGNVVSGTWIHAIPTRVAFDDYGRVYLPIMQHPYKDTSAKDAFGLGVNLDNVGSGLFVLNQAWKQPELNVAIGGDFTSCAVPANQDHGWQGLAVIAIRKNIAVLGGITCVNTLKTTANAVQAQNGGGLDGMLAIVKLWDL